MVINFLTEFTELDKDIIKKTYKNCNVYEISLNKLVYYFLKYNLKLKYNEEEIQSYIIFKDDKGLNDSIRIAIKKIYANKNYTNTKIEIAKICKNNNIRFSHKIHNDILPKKSKRLFKSLNCVDISIESDYDYDFYTLYYKNPYIGTIYELELFKFAIHL